MIQHRPDRPKPWRARVRLPGGTELSQSFRNKTDAQRWEREQRAKLDRGDRPDPHAGRLTFDRWARQVIAGRVDLAPKSRLEYADSLRRVRPHLGNMLVLSIRKAHVERMKADLSERFAAETVNKAVKLVKMVLGEAVENRMVQSNAAATVKPMPAQRRDMRILGPGDAHRLADACGDYRLFVLTAVYSGLRWGELVGLQADRVAGNRIRVDRQLSEAAGTFTWRYPKSDAGTRTVVVPHQIGEALADVRPGREGLLFTSPRGAYLRHSGFRRRRWLPAVDGTVGRPVTFHDLRHTHVAWLIGRGEHPKAIQVRLGHSSIQVTMDRYGHLMDGMNESAGTALEGVFSDAETAPPRPKIS